jgi:hypothetical protein
MAFGMPYGGRTRIPVFAVAALALALNAVGELIAGLSGAFSRGVLLQLVLPDVFALVAVLWAFRLTTGTSLAPRDGR